MSVATVNLTIYQGATFRKKFTWKAGDPAEPVDLTGYTARMQVREKITDELPLLDLTTENGGIVLTDAMNGELEIYVPADDTAALAAKKGVYDLEMVDPAGDVRRLIEGKVTIDPEVTR